MTNVWMPLYVADYLADTRHLSAAEHGAYLLLIMAYWQSGRPLPDDDVKLSRLASMTAKEWRSARETLAKMFTVEGGAWTHERIEAEMGKAGRIREQKRAAGLASAERRAQRQGNGCSTGVDEPLQRQSNQSPSPLPEVTNVTSSPPISPSARRRGKHALPSDFEPQHRIAEREGRTLEWSRRQFERMTNWALSNDVRKADWQRTFDNWCLKAIDGDGGRGPPLQADPDEVDRLLAEKANAH